MLLSVQLIVAAVGDVVGVLLVQLLRLNAGKLTNEQAHAENFLWRIRLGEIKDVFHLSLIHI